MSALPIPKFKIGDIIVIEYESKNYMTQKKIIKIWEVQLQVTTSDGKAWEYIYYNNEQTYPNARLATRQEVKQYTNPEI